jgi:hypothetical protein
VNQDEAAAFAGQWVKDWNNHDVEAGARAFRR